MAFSRLASIQNGHYMVFLTEHQWQQIKQTYLSYILGISVLKHKDKTHVTITVTITVFIRTPVREQSDKQPL